MSEKDSICRVFAECQHKIQNKGETCGFFKIFAKNVEILVMILKNTDFDTMSVSVKEFIDSPEEFLSNKEKNAVILTIVAFSENQSDSGDFLILLAKCMKVYPNLWQYVRNKLCSEYPPFKSISEDNDEKIEPPPKRRKTRKYRVTIVK